MAVARALEEPLKWIALNAGLEGSLMVRDVESREGTVGLNAETGVIEDLVKSGDHRPGEGDAVGPAERGLGRGAAPDDRRARRGQAREEDGAGGRPRPRRHGDDVVAAPTAAAVAAG